jgi:Domain of unknown function (DUF4157)
MKTAAAPVAKPGVRRNAPSELLHAPRAAGFGPHISVQRDGANASPAGTAPLVRSALSSPGRPLDAQTRAFMEPRFGHDFSAVRVHADDTAARSADAVCAHAYTAGSHIVFGRGQFAPGALGGQRLIAHELTHVIQQSRGPVPGTPIGSGVTVSDPTDSFERGAAVLADRLITVPSPVEPAPLAALPPTSGRGELVALQADWSRVGGISGVVGAVFGGLALIAAGLAWLLPRNPNATAQGINIQPNPFAFQAVNNPPQTLDDQQRYQSAAEGPGRTDPVLELRTDDRNDATFNLQRYTDGTNIISASIVQDREPKGYLGGYNSSIATLVLSAVQSNPPLPPPKSDSGPEKSPAGAAPAPANQTQAASDTGSGASAAPSAGASSTPAAQVAREVIHFSGTNGPSRDRLQTFAGELLVTGDGNVACTRCESTNGIGYGVPLGTYGLVDYRSKEAPGRGLLGPELSPESEPPHLLPSLPDLQKVLPINRPIEGAGQ